MYRSRLFFEINALTNAFSSSSFHFDSPCDSSVTYSPSLPAPPRVLDDLVIAVAEDVDGVTGIVETILHPASKFATVQAQYVCMKWGFHVYVTLICARYAGFVYISSSLYVPHRVLDDLVIAVAEDVDVTLPCEGPVFRWPSLGVF